MGAFVKRMKILAGLLASSLALPEKNAFPRKKNSQFCDISSVKGTSCDDIFRKDPTAHDGIYKIQVSGNSATIVECKFENGMGWTVIQKRSSGKLNFNRNWREYQNGFSTFSESGCKRFCGGEDICGEELVSSYGPRPNCDLDEYWIGLENIHSLTSTGALLKIDLERYNGQSGTVEYDNFVVGDRRSNYQLKSVGTFRNDRNHDIGDSFVGAGFGQQGYSPLDKQDTNHIGWGFTTKDVDNDGYESGNCGYEDESGWWFNRCSAVNLNGKHYGRKSSALNYKTDDGFDDGILWQTWTNNKFESLIGARMMVAPKPTHDEAHKEITGKDCQEIAEKLAKMGRLTSSTPAGMLDDIFRVMPDGTSVPKYTECKIQMCKNSPVGWTMVQKRYDGSIDFNQNWNAYRMGFGLIAETGQSAPYNQKREDKCNQQKEKPSWIGEGWLGNEYINALSGAQGGASMLVEMSRRSDRDPNDAVVGYRNFYVDGERNNYRLNQVSGFMNIKNSAGDAFRGAEFIDGFGNADNKESTDHQGMEFSTNDRDNDQYEEGNCGSQDRSGWWFNRCSACNLNGHFYKSGLVDKNSNGFVEYDDGVLWQTWTHTKWESIMKTKMWLAPRGALDKCYQPVSENQHIAEKPRPTRPTTRQTPRTTPKTTTKPTTKPSRSWDSDDYDSRTDDSSSNLSYGSDYDDKSDYFSEDY